MLLCRRPGALLAAAMLSLSFAGLSACASRSFPTVSPAERETLVSQARTAFSRFGDGLFEVTRFSPVAEIERSETDPFYLPVSLYGLEFEADVRLLAPLTLEPVSALRLHVGEPGYSMNEVDRRVSLVAVFNPGSWPAGATPRVHGTAVFQHDATWKLRLFDGSLSNTVGVDTRRPLEGAR
jgi:hypothetical protein